MRCVREAAPRLRRTAAAQSFWLLTFREAQTQTFADVFLCIMICFITAACLVPLMRKAVVPPRPLTDAH